MELMHKNCSYFIFVVCITFRLYYLAASLINVPSVKLAVVIYLLVQLAGIQIVTMVWSGISE